MARIKAIRIKLCDYNPSLLLDGLGAATNNNDDDLGAFAEKMSTSPLKQTQPTGGSGLFYYQPGDLVAGIVEADVGDMMITSSPQFTGAEIMNINSADEISANKTRQRLTVPLRLEGYGKTHWRGGSEQTAFKHEDVFLSDSANFIIPTGSKYGTHRFPFKFKLPDELPPSFEGKHGFIRYRVRVKFRPLQDIKVHFEVKLPDNSESPERDQVDEEEQQAREMLMVPYSDYAECDQNLFGIIPFGKRSIRAEISRRIFQHNGDTVRLTVTFTNDCQRPARPVVKLIQRQIFYGRGLISRTVKRSICEWLLAPMADLKPLGKQECREWLNVDCTLPVVAPSFQSGVIDVDYFIEIALTERMSLTQNPVVSIGVLMTTRNFAPIDDATTTTSIVKKSARIKPTLVRFARKAAVIIDADDPLPEQTSSLSSKPISIPPRRNNSASSLISDLESPSDSSGLMTVTDAVDVIQHHHQQQLLLGAGFESVPECCEEIDNNNDKNKLE